MPNFAELVKEKDLRRAGLKVEGARKLMKTLEPGGAVYNRLVVSHRLIPMKAGPPKHSAEEDAGNPNLGSNTSHRTASNSSGSMPHVIMFVLAAAPVSISIKHT